MPSNYLTKNILRHVYLGATYTPPKTIYLAAFTDKSTEVSDPSYSRQDITFSETNGKVTNDSDVLFPIATEDWGKVRYYVLFDENDNELDRALAITEDEKGNPVYPTVETNVQFGLSKGEFTTTIEEATQNKPS